MSDGQKVYSKFINDTTKYNKVKKIARKIIHVFLIEVYLIYNIVLVLGIKQSDLAVCSCVYVYIFFLKFFFIMEYYRVLHIVSCEKQ